MRRRRVAIVTPWYGEESHGGAELLARELAVRLAEQDEVTVLTTTSRSFLAEWDANYYKPGKKREGNHSVVRFPICIRDRERFQRLNDELLTTPRAEWSRLRDRRTKTDPFIDESINSTGLERHLASKARFLYDRVLFLPYLYGVVVRGIEAYPGPAYLIPCLHDEVYARIPRIEDAIHRARALLFNSVGEAELAIRLYGPGIVYKSHVIGTGVAPHGVAPSRIPVASRYFLYLGRREPEKGAKFLVDLFRQRNQGGLSDRAALVLAGPGAASYDDPNYGIYDLGFVDEGTKRGLLRNALALLIPSVYESYSRVMMEAWLEGTPVVAHAHCLPTACAVRDSGGGFVAATTEEWLKVLACIEYMNSEQREALGRKGIVYTSEHADWQKTIDRLRKVFDADQIRAQRAPRRVDQVMEGFDSGDAISQQALFIREQLRRRGLASDIYAVRVPPRCKDALQLRGSVQNIADAIVYHHSIGSNAAWVSLQAPRKALVYHNVTPARFFAPYLPGVARQLEQGRAQLAAMASEFDLIIADSEYNASELRELGINRPLRTIPALDDFSRFDVTPNRRVTRTGRGGVWLFVGRIAPNKGIAALIDAFEAYLALDEGAVLFIVGKYDQGDPYFRELNQTLAERHLDPYVTFTGFVEAAGLASYYRTATVFVCLSEHEGFCVPIVEAMFFDVPVIAKGVAAIAETLGPAGILLQSDADCCDVAAAVYAVHRDEELRCRLIETQREYRRKFLPKVVGSLIDEAVTSLLS